MNPADYFTKNNLPTTNLHAVTKQSVNQVYLTDDFVLKIVRPDLSDHINHESEARLGLKAAEVGIKTARPVAWDSGYSIWERLPGHALSNPATCSSQIWNDLLDTLEQLHQNPLEPLNNPVTTWTGDSSFIQKTQSEAHWSDAERDKLGAALTTPSLMTSPRFIHGDAYADNIIVDEGAFVGLIDWGNAGWRCLESECSSLDTPALELALERWRPELKLPLLRKMRLNLCLEVASYGRLPYSAVRAVLQRLE